MRNDQELHQLFRARLPIATLPKEFADRLTKAVLDEVGNLRQTHPITQGCSTRPVEGAAAYTPLSKPNKSAPLSRTAKTVIFFLLLNFLCLPFLQGCTLPLQVQSTPIMELAESQRQSWQPRSIGGNATLLLVYPAVILSGVPRIKRASSLPPLPPITPQLPILQFWHRMLLSNAKLVLSLTPSADGVVNTAGPLTTTQSMTVFITMTVPYEPQLASQEAPPDKQFAPTAVDPVQPILTATPTADLLVDLPITKLTTTPTTAAPILSIFEPTPTPNTLGEEPTGAATAVPTAIPTICLEPWQTGEPAPTNTPESES